MSHGFVRSSASASTTHEHSRLLQCLCPRERSPYPAIRHTPDTHHVCVLTLWLKHGQAGCALWDLTHRSQFIMAVFFTRGNTHSRGYDNFHALALFCPSKYQLSLQYTHSRTVRSPSHLKLALLTNGVYDLHDRTIFVHLCVCVWCGTLTDTWQFTSSQVQFLLPKD